jgi:hypothetical protein
MLEAVGEVQAEEHAARLRIGIRRAFAAQVGQEDQSV